MTFTNDFQVMESSIPADMPINEYRRSRDNRKPRFWRKPSASASHHCTFLSNGKCPFCKTAIGEIMNF